MSISGALNNPKVRAVITGVLDGGVASTIFNLFLGRCTFFAIVFAIAGVWGFIHGKDLTSFSLFVTAMQGLLVLHSWKEDVAERESVRADLIKSGAIKS